MKVLGWWSRTSEVLIALDAQAAQQLVAWVMEHKGKGWIIPPVAVQLHDQITLALRDAPPHQK